MLTWSHHPLHLVDLQNSSKWDFANTYCLLHYVCGTIVVTWSSSYYVVVTETSVQEVTECHATDGAVGGQYSWNNQSIVKKKKLLQICMHASASTYHKHFRYNCDILAFKK